MLVVLARRIIGHSILSSDPCIQVGDMVDESLLVPGERDSGQLHRCELRFRRPVRHQKQDTPESSVTFPVGLL